MTKIIKFPVPVRVPKAQVDPWSQDAPIVSEFTSRLMPVMEAVRFEVRHVGR
jgi:hypothetical protein